MSHATRPPHRRGNRLILMGAGILFVFALTQCRSVTDNVSSSRDGATPSANCVSACAHAAADSMRVESDLHVAIVHTCNGTVRCLTNENNRHIAAVKRIDAFRKQCQDNCHKQGGGGGGR